MSSIVPLTLSLQQAADYVGVGRDKMRDLIRTKRIKAFILDRRIKVKPRGLRGLRKESERYRADALAPDFAAPRLAIKRRAGKRKLRPCAG
jgi:excisionase family DNA binding protein